MKPLFSTAQMFDNLREQGIEGVQVLPATLCCYGGLKSYYGQMATAVQCRGEGAGVRDVLAEPGQGRVLVIDNHDDRTAAVIGDRLSALGLANGWVGMVVNGLVRDVGVLRNMRFGIHARGAIPSRPRQFGAIESDVPLQFMGAEFRPGEWIYVDEDGMLLSAQELVLAL